jgi:hypothetical protein
MYRIVIWPDTGYPAFLQRAGYRISGFLQRTGYPAIFKTGYRITRLFKNRISGHLEPDIRPYIQYFVHI